MGYLPMISSLTYFVAIDQGYFRDEKLDVQGIPIGTSDNITKNLVNHEIDLAIELSVSPLLKDFENQKLGGGNEKRTKFLIFSHSLIDENNGFDSLLVRKDSPITDWRQLSGKKIGAFPGTTAERTILDVFKRDFGNLPPPVVLAKPPTLHLAGLANQEFDAIHTYEPFLTQGLVIHRFRRVRTSLYAAQMPKDANGEPMKSPIGVGALNRQWAEDSPDVARRAVLALDKATIFIERYPDRAKMIAAQFTGTDPAVASAMNIMPMTSSAQTQPKLLQAYFSILTNLGEIKSAPPASSLLFKAE